MARVTKVAFIVDGFKLRLGLGIYTAFLARLVRREESRDASGSGMERGKEKDGMTGPPLLFVVGGDGSWSALSASRVVPPTGLRGLMS